MRKIAIIGTGKIGSSHLQALKAVNIPLKIYVVEPSLNSLEIAREKYDSTISSHTQQEIKFLQEITEVDENLDLAIIATNSDVRREVIEQLFKNHTVKFLILEKVLFQRVEDYHFISNLLKVSNCKAWVNCNIRVMPDYRDLVKGWFNNQKLLFTVSGSQWGLMCNAIHFIDYLTYLIDCKDFVVDTTYLDQELISSKREGFFELTGIIQLHFNDGSHAILACQSTGDLPIIIDISSATTNCSINLVKKNGNAIICEGDSEWKSFDVEYMYVSKLNTFLVEEILLKGECSLPTYEYSMKIHLAFFEPVLKFLNNISGSKFDKYPFT